jgi:hypothetical protein
VKVTEKKKEKKTSQDKPTEQKDNATQETPVETPNAEKPKDKKKKKKSKRAISTSTHLTSDASISEKQPDNPPVIGNPAPQNLPLEKTSEQNNESSNSCLQPPPIKVFSKILFCILKTFHLDLFLITLRFLLIF